MTGYNWEAIVALHRSRGCAFDGFSWKSHTCKNATRQPTNERKPLPDYLPVTQPDGPEREP